MFNLNWQIDGDVVPSDFEDVTTPIGKLTYVYKRGLEANKVTVATVTANGKTIEIEDLVGVNHA